MNINDRSGPSSELLRTFCTVAEQGNVTQAAAVLSRTQSAVSVKIRQLEDQLSVSLFNRLSRGVELTDEGQRLLPIAKKALREIDRVGDLFSDPLKGRIRIGIPDDYNEMILEQVLADFCRRHQLLEVFVQSGCTAAYPDAIDRGDLDLAIYSGVPGRAKQAFFIEETVWVAGPEFTLKGNVPIPLAIFDRNCRWRNVPTETLDEQGIEWRVAYLTENYSSFKAAIRSGLAIGILPKSAVDAPLKILDNKTNLPLLPATSRSFLKNKSADPDTILAMESAILKAVQN